MNILVRKITPFSVRAIGMLTIDVDSNAERFMIMDRVTGAMILHTKPPLSKTVKTLVSLSYTTSNNIIVGILDDAKVYDCKFIDGIQAELVDANTVDMSQ
ncbi:hypothetical protein [Shewanella scandinavica]|uniref:hypothetical protein n=1 Tax=Shewanella scandinavica TaxID=3063538 RepID=UPI0031953C6B